MSRQVIKMELPSDVRLLKAVHEFVSLLADHLLFSEREKMHLSLCVSELATNGIYYGNRNDLRKKIRLIFDIQDTRLVLKVRDQGSGFDLEKIRRRERKLSVHESNGRGIYLVDSYMDKVETSRTRGGFEIIATKLRATGKKE